MNSSDSRIARDTAMTSVGMPSDISFAISSDTAAHKRALRSSLLAARKALTPAIRDAAAAQIGRHLLDWISQRGVTSIAVYMPMRGEPDLTHTWSALAASGVKLCLPIVTARDAPLSFAVWQPDQSMARDCIGIAVPAPPHRPCVPQALVIPCLGITPQRFRLGYGGGFYDRTLAILPSVTTVGIAFDCCMTEFSHQSHDIAMHAVITERGIL